MDNAEIKEKCIVRGAVENKREVLRGRGDFRGKGDDGEEFWGDLVDDENGARKETVEFGDVFIAIGREKGDVAGVQTGESGGFRVGSLEEVEISGFFRGILDGFGGSCLSGLSNFV